jgi:hypothetical protein
MSKGSSPSRRRFLSTAVGAVVAARLAGASSAIGGSPARKAVSGPPKILSRATVFTHPSSDPYARDNYYGFNHAASVTTLSDGRLLSAWFSGPFEASVDQVILGSYSSDGGRTWSAARVLQDFPHVSDFDPAFIADGKRTWFFSRRADGIAGLLCTTRRTRLA